VQRKPVVATDSFGPGTLIEHLETGVLVPVDDTALLTKAIRVVLGDDKLRERISVLGYEAYTEQFTEDIVTRRYIEFFKEILAPASGPSEE
jgi:glycosyltransferase involved in cell wall biosynthesis